MEIGVARPRRIWRCGAAVAIGKNPKALAFMSRHAMPKDRTYPQSRLATTRKNGVAKPKEVVHKTVVVQGEMLGFFRRRRVARR